MAINVLSYDAITSEGDKLYAEALASITFAIVCYQDFRERMVSDIAWIPAIVAIPVAFWEAGTLWWVVAAKIGILALVAMLGLLFQAFGEGDSIGLTLMGVGVGILSPLPQLMAMAVFALASISFIMIKHGGIRIEKVLPLEEASSQNIWIPVEIMLDGRSIEPRGTVHKRSPLYSLVLVSLGVGVGAVNSFTLVKVLGMIGQDPLRSLIIILLGCVAGGVLGYFVQRNGSKYEDAWESLNEYKNMGASVKVAHGVPLVGYMAVGYIVYFIYLVLPVLSAAHL